MKKNKIGHPRNFETPDDLWSAFEGYREWVKTNPVRKMVFVGKDGVKDYELIDRPFTMEGFENYCEENYGYVHQYFVNQEGLYNDYMNICSRIKRQIRQHQIEGGMAGIYNPSITQRLNGLTEKTENQTNITGTIEITLDLGE